MTASTFTIRWVNW